MIQPVINSANHVIYIWKIQNSPSVILKRELRQKEIELFLNNEFPGTQLNRDKSGAPCISSNPYAHISISHSGDWFALQLAHENCGVDIQQRNKQITGREEYFLNENEQKLFKNENDLYLAWGAKESLIKFFKGETSSIKYHINLTSLDRHVQTILATSTELNFTLKFIETSDYTLVYIENYNTSAL